MVFKNCLQKDDSETIMVTTNKTQNPIKKPESQQQQHGHEQTQMQEQTQEVQQQQQQPQSQPQHILQQQPQIQLQTQQQLHDQQMQLVQQLQQQLQQQNQTQIMHLQLPTSLVTSQHLANNTITITQGGSGGGVGCNTNNALKTLNVTTGGNSHHDATVLNLPTNFVRLTTQGQFVNTSTGQVLGHVKLEK